MPEGYLSINSKICDILQSLRGKIALGTFLLKQMSQVAKNSGEKKPNGSFPITRETLQMLGSFTILRMSGMVGMMGITLKEKDLLDLNRKLNKIKVPEK